jgi:outer membrane murein-binding lipoprotein Lpp
MRIVAASVMLGSLVLAGAPPQAAGQSLGPNAHTLNARMLLVADDDDTDRSSFTQHAQDDIHQWQRKVHDFGRQTKAAGQQGANSAKHDLDDAFAKAKVAADQLRTVGADGWHGAKTTYQKASHDLADTWNRIKP